MKTKKQGNNWTAYHDPETGRYFAEIMYTSREGREQYDYEITKEIFDRLGTFASAYFKESTLPECEYLSLLGHDVTICLGIFTPFERRLIL